jgi:DNA-binding XRE family transcriptional regulator
LTLQSWHKNAKIVIRSKRFVKLIKIVDDSISADAELHAIWGEEGGGPMDILDSNGVELHIEKRFGNRMKELRLAKDISQQELAVRSGLHRNYISDAERGKRNVSLKCIEKIALGLECSLKDLF